MGSEAVYCDARFSSVVETPNTNRRLLFGAQAEFLHSYSYWVSMRRRVRERSIYTDHNLHHLAENPVPL